MHNLESSILPEKMILNYHLMHPGGNSKPGDPNLAFCLDGYYHLHYIFSHTWKGNKSFSFIHVKSKDMLNWEWLNTKLQPSFTGHGMFSGTGFITKYGKPAAIYCAYKKNNRNTFITIAKDNTLNDWHKPYQIFVKNGPKGKNISLLGDPDCFLIDDTYYAYSAMSSISNSNIPSMTTAFENVLLCKSKDLVNWEYVGKLFKYDTLDVIKGEDLSCANMFPINDKWMILCISHSMGCRYYIGDWDKKNEQFIPEKHGRMNWPRSSQPLLVPLYRDFFAPESLITKDGRRIMWSWLYTLDKKVEYKSIQSLPRELSLCPKGGLLIKPLSELKKLRYDSLIIKNILVPNNSNKIKKIATENLHDNLSKSIKYFTTNITKLRGESFEINIQINRKEAERRRFGFILFSNNNFEGLTFLFRPESNVISVGETVAPFDISDLPEKENIDIQIFIDKYIIEFFINNRQSVVTSFMDYKNTGCDFNAYTFSGHGDKAMQIKKIQIWKLKSTNKGFYKAMENQIWKPETQ